MVFALKIVVLICISIKINVIIAMRHAMNAVEEAMINVSTAKIPFSFIMENVLMIALRECLKQVSVVLIV